MLLRGSREDRLGSLIARGRRIGVDVLILAQGMQPLVIILVAFHFHLALHVGLCLFAKCHDVSEGGLSPVSGACWLEARVDRGSVLKRSPFMELSETISYVPPDPLRSMNATSPDGLSTPLCRVASGLNLDFPGARTSRTASRRAIGVLGTGGYFSLNPNPLSRASHGRTECKPLASPMF